MIAYHRSLTPASLPGPVLDALLGIGWYRMHQRIFTTTHLQREVFYRVHWLRYPVQGITPRSSHRRIRKQNKTFRNEINSFLEIQPEHELLYQKYRETIDFDGPMTIRDCLLGEDGVNKGIYQTHCISIFDRDKLIAVGYFDTGSLSAASILHFYDPEYRKYGLGKYLILLTLDYLAQNGYTYYYPGYLVAGMSKMDYKLFLGSEAVQYFDPTIGWLPFDKKILTAEEMAPMRQLEILLAFQQ